MSSAENQLPPDIAEMPFEKSLEELESIVARMENERMPLEMLIGSFERGNQLARHCRERLDALEKRIEVLTRGADGAPAWEEFKQP